MVPLARASFFKFPLQEGNLVEGIVCSSERRMEVGYVRGRMSREASPERVKVHLPSKARQALKKVHVIYYLSRNGQLEQPHFMEVALHPNKHLRLKDVMERLGVLRGRAMISLYSWSCKRSYRNGFVWNDLGEDDVIYPSDGSEYILKGSEILEDCREDSQQMKSPTPKRSPQAVAVVAYNHGLPPDDVDEAEDCKVLHQYKPNSAGSQCSRGVSTEEETCDSKRQLQQQIELSANEEEDASPPSSASSDKTTIINPDPEVEEPQMRALSVLQHLIACGNPMSMKRRASLLMKSPLSGNGGGGVMGGSGRKSSVGLQRSVLCRVAAARANADDEEMNEIKFMSENPRFCQQLEEKEYFSGSIVEEMRGSAPEPPSLKKSSSYNEERSSSKCRVGDDRVIKVEEKSVRGGCIPSKKRGSSKQQKAAEGRH